jgi:putative DNA primase/helicase
LILQNDIELKGKFRLNDFDRRAYVFSSLPWRKIKKPGPLRDIDEAGIRNYIETIYGIFGAQKIKDSLDVEIEKNHYHPIRDYLDGLKWDGKERIENLLIDYFGAVDNLYTRHAMRKTLIGAVSRVYEPGCQFDLVLILVGVKEGTGKSTFFYKLGKQWFSDTFVTVHGKEALEQIQGSWIIEIAELAGIKKAEADPVKQFLTKRTDYFRKSYGHNNEEYPRQCIFVGTTNSNNVMWTRRFMPVDVREDKATKSSLTKELDDELDQIWAEAVFHYNLGEPPFLDKEINELADQSRTAHAEVDERSGYIEKYLNKDLPENWEDIDFYSRRLYFLNDDEEGTCRREYVCAAEIWCECLQKNREDMDRYKTREINEIMKNMKGWAHVNSTRNFKLYGKQKYYRRL